MLFTISLILWYILQVKQILFWLYLWQLKDYHLGRLMAHFSTSAGQELMFGKTAKLKILFCLVSLFVLIFGRQMPSLALWLLNLNSQTILYFYLIAGSAGLLFLVFGKARVPKFNLKILFLFIASFLGFALLQNIVIGVVSAYFFIQMGEVVALPTIDLLLPIVISSIVLFWQPLTTLWQRIVMFLAKRKISKRNDLIVVGITGSYGKSTTKEILACILSKKYKVCKTKKNQNSEIGISRAVLNDLQPEHQIFVCEMGAYNLGGIKMLCDIVKPKFGVLTGINEQHQATFGSFENISSAKFELAQALPADGALFLNAYNKNVKAKTNSSFSVKQKFVIGPQGDLWAENIAISIFAVEFDLLGKNISRQRIKIDLPGGQGLIENALLSIAVAMRLGISLEDIVSALKTLPRDLSAFFIGKSASGINLAKATYSSNPDGVISALQYFKNFSGKKIIVMPCLIELGSSAPRVHYEIGQAIGKTCDLAIITNSDYFFEIRKGASESGMLNNRVVCITDSKKITKEISFFAVSGDSVLIQGRVNPILINRLDNI